MTAVSGFKPWVVPLSMVTVWLRPGSRPVGAGQEFGAPGWLHTKGSLSRIVKAWRDARPMNRWLDQHVGPSTLAPPEPR